MGSYANAVMVGFVCRLCSENKRCVIHFYGAKAKAMGLLDKIRILPIRIEKHDNLPKTVCIDCIEKLNQQYDLIKKIQRSMLVHRQHSLYHTERQCPMECPLCMPDNSDDADAEVETLLGGSNR